MKLVVDRDGTISMSVGVHAPKGGATIAGKHFTGGEFIPKGVLAQASAEDKAKLKPTRAGYEAVKGNVVDTGKVNPKTNKPVFKKADDKYVHAGGEGELTMPMLQRIRTLKIPPGHMAKGVVLARDPKAKIQAVATDAQGKDHYFYRADHHEQAAVAKWKRVAAFMAKGGAFDKLQANVDKAIHGPDSPLREAALVLAFMAHTGIRVDSEGAVDARVKSYGASTLEPRHVQVDGDTVHYDFIGKEGVRNYGSFSNPLIAREIERRLKQDRPKLFDANYGAVTKAFKQLGGGGFLVKDLRTAVANETAYHAIEGMPAPKTPEEYQAQRIRVGQIVGRKLNHAAERGKEKIGPDGHPLSNHQMSLDNYINPEVFIPWKANLERQGFQVSNDSEKQSKPSTTSAPKAKSPIPSSGTPRKPVKTQWAKDSSPAAKMALGSQCLALRNGYITLVDRWPQGTTGIIDSVFHGDSEPDDAVRQFRGLLYGQRMSFVFIGPKTGRQRVVSSRSEIPKTILRSGQFTEHKDLEEHEIHKLADEADKAFHGLKVPQHLQDQALELFHLGAAGHTPMGKVLERFREIAEQVRMAGKKARGEKVAVEPSETPPSPPEQKPANQAIDHSAIEAAMQNTNPEAHGGALVSIRDLRKSMGNPASLDKALLDMAAQGKLALHKHDLPASLPPAERANLLKDAQGNEYVGVALRPKKFTDVSKIDKQGREFTQERFNDEFKAAFDKLDKASGNRNYLFMSDLRAALPHYTNDQFNAALRELRFANKYTAESSEGHVVKLTGEQRAGGIEEAGRRLVYLRRVKDDREPDQKKGEESVATEAGPHEGDRNAEGLVFHDGRWHREDAGQAGEKEPHEMTREEYRKYFDDGGKTPMPMSGADVIASMDWGRQHFGPDAKNRLLHGDAGDTQHLLLIANQLRQGKPVPSKVLADYPDLAKANTTPEPVAANPEGITANEQGTGTGAGTIPDAGGDRPGSGVSEQRRVDSRVPDGAIRKEEGNGTQRILTDRSEFTSPAKTELVPENLRQHLTSDQQAGVAKALEAMDRYGGFLLADGTGVGKTRQLLAIADRYAKQGKKVVIVAPAEVIKPKWDKGTTAKKGSYTKDGAAMGVGFRLVRGSDPLPTGTVSLTTYNNIGDIAKQADSNTVVLFDESHYMKNSSSARSKHGKTIGFNAGKVMYATATPADKALHLGHLLRAGVFGGGDERSGKFWGKAADTYTKLGLIQKTVYNRHAGREITSWVVNPKLGHDEVTRRISGLMDQMTKDGLMIQRTLSMDNVDARLHPITLSDEAKRATTKVYDDMMDEHDNKAIALMAMRRSQEPHKISEVGRLVQEELAAGRQPIVFLGRVNDLTADEDSDDDEDTVDDNTAKLLKQHLLGIGISEADIGELHGAATKTADAKSRAMEHFNDGKTKVLISTIQSGGTGVNLDDTVGDRPRTVIMMTPPLSANDMIQAAGRVNRLTTKSPAKLVTLVSDHEVDEWNMALLAKKMETSGAALAKNMAQLIEKHRPAETDRFDWGQSLIRTKLPAGVQAGATTTPEPAPQPVGPAPSPFVEKSTAKFTAEQKRVIHAAAKWLHSLNDDRAREVNGMGYNKFDGDHGAALANLPELSDAQAERGLKMLRKYQGQLNNANLTLPHDSHIQRDEPPKPQAVSQQPTKKVNTKNGERHIISWRPTSKFWDLRKAGKLPSEVSVKKNDRTGEWEATIWGTSPDHANQVYSKLRELGGQNMALKQRTVTDIMEGIENILQQVHDGDMTEEEAEEAYLSLFSEGQAMSLGGIRMAYVFTGPRTGKERTVSTLGAIPKSVRASGKYKEVKAKPRAKSELHGKTVKQLRELASKEGHKGHTSQRRKDDLVKFIESARKAAAKGKAGAGDFRKIAKEVAKGKKPKPKKPKAAAAIERKGNKLVAKPKESHLDSIADALVKLTNPSPPAKAVPAPEKAAKPKPLTAVVGGKPAPAIEPKLPPPHDTKGHLERMPDHQLFAMARGQNKYHDPAASRRETIAALLNTEKPIDRLLAERRAEDIKERNYKPAGWTDTGRSWGVQTQTMSLKKSKVARPRKAVAV